MTTTGTKNNCMV